MAKLSFNVLVCALVLLVAFLTLANAKCAYDEMRDKMISRDPEAYYARMKSLDDQESLLMSNSSHQHALRAPGDNVITIVFHFMWNAAQQANPALRAAAIARIPTEMTYANNWWKQQNPYYVNRDPFFAAVIQDTPAAISFNLATVDANGAAFPGYTETNFPFAQCDAGAGETSYYNTARGGRTPFDQTKFLNVYICNLKPGIAGFAYLAQSPPSPDDTHAVFTAAEFGSTESQGSTFVHEFMHFIRIDHTFQGGCSGVGDSVDDTPPTSGPAQDQFSARKCSKSPVDPTATATDFRSCAARTIVAQVENVMDYNTEPCIRYFTKGQTTRILNSFSMNPWKQLAAYSASIALPTCTPSCTGKQCGDNGCGGSCGQCLSSETCTTNQCVAPALSNTACTAPTLISTAFSAVVNNKPSAGNSLTTGCGTNVATISAPLYYRVVGANTLVTVSTCGNSASGPTAVSVFSGCPANLATNCVAGNSGFCGTNGQVTFCAGSGTTYNIVAGTTTGSGQFNLAISFGAACTVPAPPPACVPSCAANFCGSNGCGGQCACAAGSTCLANQQCLAPTVTQTNVDCATAIALPPVTVAGSTLLVSTTGIPNNIRNTPCLVTPNVPGVYYSFVGTGNTVRITTCSATFIQNLDTILSVYSGTCGALSCVATNDDDANCATDNTASTVNVCTRAGVTYFLDVRGYDQTGPIQFTISDLGVACTPFASVNCATAANALTSSSIIYDNTNAPQTLNYPSCEASNLENNVLYNPSWHSFVAATNNTHAVSTCSANTNLDTLVNVLQANCSANLFRCLGTNDDDSSCAASPLASTATFCATAGQTYFATVAGYQLATGRFSVNVRDTGVACCQPTVACPVDAECGTDSCGNVCRPGRSCAPGTTCNNLFKCGVPSISPSASVQPSSGSTLSACFNCRFCQNGRKQGKSVCRQLGGTVSTATNQYCCTGVPISVRDRFFFTWKSVKVCNDLSSHRVLRGVCSDLGGSVFCRPPRNTRSNKYRYTCSRGF